MQRRVVGCRTNLHFSTVRPSQLHGVSIVRPLGHFMRHINTGTTACDVTVFMVFQQCVLAATSAHPPSLLNTAQVFLSFGVRTHRKTRTSTTNVPQSFSSDRCNSSPAANPIVVLRRGWDSFGAL